MVQLKRMSLFFYIHPCLIVVPNVMFGSLSTDIVNVLFSMNAGGKGTIAGTT